MIPVNRQNGTSVGIIGQLHLFLDDFSPYAGSSHLRKEDQCRDDVRSIIVRRYLHILVGAALVCVMPTFAKAHAFLDHANPRVGSTVTPAPKEMVPWFTQKLEPAFGSIEDRGLMPLS